MNRVIFGMEISLHHIQVLLYSIHFGTAHVLETLLQLLFATCELSCIFWTLCAPSLGMFSEKKHEISIAIRRRHDIASCLHGPLVRK